MHRAVLLECWGEIYFWFTLIKNIKWCVCVIVREKYVALRANRATGLRVKVLQDIFEIDCIEMAHMIAESENNLINI